MGTDLLIRVCSGCGVEKPLNSENFLPRSDRPGKFHSPCRKCHNERNRQSYYKSPESKRAKNKAWQDAHPEKMAEYAAKYLSSDKAKQYHVEWVAENRESVRAAARRYARANPEKVQARRRKWGREHPLEIRDYCGQYRARKKSTSDGTVNYKKILEEFGMVCHICNGDIADKADLHFDHVIPLSRGGRHTFDNVRPSHAHCNLVKWANSVGEV